MRKTDSECIQRILDNEPVVAASKVRFDVSVGSALVRGRLISTATRLLLYATTPMGMQATVVRLRSVEHITTGKKGHRHYLQLLGEGSRILVLFKSKETRNSFLKQVAKQVAPPT